MTTTWDAGHLLLLFLMWVVMMTAMMLPSASPTLLLYASVARAADAARYPVRVYALAAGYLAVWSLFSAAAALAQGYLTASSIVSPMMVLADRRLGAALLGVVAVYQFTPLKRDCLAACRSPLALITRHWRPHTAGAFRMGLRYGLYCLGCCWALMLLLFAGGVMNVFVIVALTSYVLIEKVAPWGIQASRTAGAALAVVALLLLSL